MPHLSAWHSFCLLISVEMQIKNLSPVMNQQRHPMPMKAHDGGFSLIEILVVIGAIGILIGIAIPAYNVYREKAQIAEVQQVLKDIERAIIALAIDTGVWPANEPIGMEGNDEVYNLNDPEGGLTNNANDLFSNWNGPYIPVVPLDPWGSNYFFDPDYSVPGDPSHVPVVGSLGPDALTAYEYRYNADNIILRLPCKKPDCQ